MSSRRSRYSRYNFFKKVNIVNLHFLFAEEQKRDLRSYFSSLFFVYKAKVATTLEFLVAKLNVLVALATVLVAISSPGFRMKKGEAQWPNGQCIRSQSERSRFEPWLGTLCCVLGQDTSLSRCLSPPRSINGYRRFVGET